MGPREKAEEFIRLLKDNTVLPKDDTNLSGELFMQRAIRKMMDNFTGNNEALFQMEALLEDVPVSEYFKQHLIEQFGSEMVHGWTGWNEEVQGKLIKDLYGISLKENAYGIFNPELAFKTETNYYYQNLPFLEVMQDPKWVKKWGQNIFKRLQKEI